MEIREGNSQDTLNIESLLIELHAESIYKTRKVENSKLNALIESFIIDKSRCCFVAIDGTEIVGVFIGYVGEFFFSHELGAWDMLLYVRKRYRGSEAAAKLCNRYKTWAKSKGALMIWQMTSTGIDNDRSVRFMSKMGFSLVGSAFVIVDDD